jgi:hypothetical protein
VRHNNTVAVADLVAHFEGAAAAVLYYAVLYYSIAEPAAEA